MAKIVDWEAVDKSLNEISMFSKSEIHPIIKGKKKSFTVRSLYNTKSLDPNKKRFAEDALLSKKYEKILENNLLEWAKMFKIDTTDIDYNI